jgi:MFS family permease
MFARPSSVRGVFTNLAEGLDYVRRTGVVLLAIVAIGVIATFGINFSILIPPLAQGTLHVGAEGFGFLMAASGIGSLLAALAIAFGGTKPTRMLLGGLVLGVAEILMGVIGNYPTDLILMFVAGTGSITMMATANTTIQSVVPDELRGRVMSVYTTVFVGTSPIGGLLLGALASNAGAPAAIAWGGGVSAVAAVLGFVWYRRISAPGRPAGAAVGPAGAAVAGVPVPSALSTGKPRPNRTI